MSVIADSVQRLCVDIQILITREDAHLPKDLRPEKITALRIASVALRSFGIFMGCWCIYNIAAQCFATGAACFVLSHDLYLMGDNVSSLIACFHRIDGVLDKVAAYVKAHMLDNMNVFKGRVVAGTLMRSIFTL